MSFKEKAKKFGHWAEDNSTALILGVTTIGLVGFSLYARKVINEEAEKYDTWLAGEEERGNRVLPGPEGFVYIFDGDGNSTVKWVG